MNNTNNKREHDFWLSNFGEEYFARNNTYEYNNSIYKGYTGVDLSDIYDYFFSDLSRDLTILEIGCNIGLKLEILQKMGFRNLTGLDLNANALEVAKKHHPQLNFINSTIEDLDPKSHRYDLVFTSVVLIHQNPKSLNSVINKIIDISQKYIFGHEYYSENLMEIDYRGNKGVMWKQDFPKLFKKIEPKLELIKQKKYPYLKDDLEDIGYLFKK